MASIGLGYVWSTNTLNIAASNMNIGTWKSTTNLSQTTTSLLQSSNVTPVLSISNSNIGIGTLPNISCALDVNGLTNSATLSVSSLSPNTALIANSSKQLTSTSVTATELGYVSGVTSSIQTQINSLTASTGATPTGAISDVYTTNLTASRATVSSATGKLTTSEVTATELGYVAGVTSAIQTQLNTMNANIQPAPTGAISDV